MGPELTRIGDKVRRDWLFSFLKDPHRVQPDTPMLQYRLTDDQLRDLTAFLLDEYRIGGRGAEPPPVAYQDARAPWRPGAPVSSAAAARAVTSSPASPTPAASVRAWPASPIAIPTSCPTAARRPAHDRQLHLPQGAAARRARAALADADLRLHAGRRREDHAGAGEHPQGRPAGVLRRAASPPPRRTAGRAASASSSTRYRCLSCHSVGGFGGDLSTVPLDRIGSQLKRDYVARYLLNPGAVRVSVEARMPVFHMLPDEANTIADYLSTRVPRRQHRAVRRELHGGRDAPRAGAVPASSDARRAISSDRGRLRRSRAVDDRRAAEARMDCGLARATPQTYKPGTLQPDYGLSAADARALTAYLTSLGPAEAGGGGRDEATRMPLTARRAATSASRRLPRRRPLRPAIRCSTPSAPTSASA